MLYDEVDKNKLKFSKRIEAVESLIFKASNVQFNVFYVNSSWFRSFLFVNMHPITYYLNWYSIRKFKPAENVVPFFFSKKLLESFEDVKPFLQNQWVPNELKSPFKGIFLYKVIHRIKARDLDGPAVILGAKREGLADFEEVYSIEYEGQAMETFDQFLIRMREILELYESYFVSQLGEKPDFSEE